LHQNNRQKRLPWPNAAILIGAFFSLFCESQLSCPAQAVALFLSLPARNMAAAYFFSMEHHEMLHLLVIFIDISYQHFFAAGAAVSVPLIKNNYFNMLMKSLSNCPIHNVPLTHVAQKKRHPGNDSWRRK